MNQWNNGLILSSILVFVFCIIYEYKRRGNNHHNIFVLAMITLLIAAICDQASLVLSAQPNSKIARYASDVTMIYFVVHNMLGILYALYVIEVSGNRKNLSKKFYAFMSIPFICLEIFTLFNPLHHQIYYYVNNTYVRGQLVSLIYLEASFYFVVGSYFFFRYRKVFVGNDIFSIMQFASIAIVGSIFQGIFPLVKIELIAEAITSIGFLLTIEYENSERDEVTMLPNKQAFIADVNRLILNKKKFQAINIRFANMPMYRRSLSKEEYNRLFQKLSHDISKFIGLNNVMYRYSENNFVILTQSKNADDIKKRELLLKEQLECPILIDHVVYILQSVLGSAVFNEDFDDLESLQYIIEREYTTVSTGCQILTREQIEKGFKEAKLDNLIEKALKENLFEVYYQPIWNNETKKITAAEALIRLKDENGNYVSPEIFIPVSEKNGMIIQIGRYVFKEVCKFISKHDMEALGLEYIEFNLSVYQLTYAQLIEEFKQIMEKYNVDRKYLNIEITETADVDNPALLERIHSFKELGFNFSLDDYGTGYSNLARLLSDFYVNVKIDKGILWDSESNEAARDLLDNLIKAMRNINLNIIQEGVETKQQLDYVTSAGANLIQGYYFSKPINEDSFVSYVSDYNNKSLEMA